MLKTSTSAAAIALLSASLFAQDQFIKPFGTPLGVTGTSVTTVTLGHNFTMPGGMVVTQLDVDSNCRIFPVGSDTSDAGESTAELLNDPFPVLAFRWDGMGFTDPNANIYFDTDGTRTLISWTNVNFGVAPPATGQVQLYPDGSVVYVYDSRVANDDGHVGLSAGGGIADPGGSDLSTVVTMPIISAGPIVYQDFGFAVGTDDLDLQSTALRFIPNSPGGLTGYTVIGNLGVIDSNPQFAVVEDLNNACTSGPISISWFQDGMNGYIVAADTGVPFDANIGASVAPTDDSLRPGALGFNFTMPGGTQVSTVDIDSNGRIMAQGADFSDFSPTLGEFLTTTGPTICPFWVDLNATIAGTGGDVSFFTDNVSRANITWNAAQFGGGVGDNLLFQLQLDAGMPGDTADDSWTVVFESITSYDGLSSGLTNGNNVFIGCCQGTGAVDPGETDVSVGVTTMGNPTQYEFLDDTIPENQDLQIRLGGRLTADTAPVVGASFDITLSEISPTTSFGVFGFGATNLNAPLGLVFPGNPCTLNSSLEFFTPGVTLPGPSSLSLDLTGAGPQIVGLTLIVQGVLADFSAPVGPVPVVTSNALIATFGE